MRAEVLISSDSPRFFQWKGPDPDHHISTAVSSTTIYPLVLFISCVDRAPCNGVSIQSYEIVDQLEETHARQHTISVSTYLKRPYDNVYISVALLAARNTHRSSRVPASRFRRGNGDDGAILTVLDIGGCI